MSASPIGAIPLRASPGNWRNQTYTLLRPVEVELAGKLKDLERQAEEVRRELADARDTMRKAGVYVEMETSS